MIQYIQEQLHLLNERKTYTDWEEAHRQGSIAALEDVLEQHQQVMNARPTRAQVTHAYFRAMLHRAQNGSAFICIDDFHHSVDVEELSIHHLADAEYLSDRIDVWIDNGAATVIS